MAMATLNQTIKEQLYKVDNDYSKLIHKKSVSFKCSIIIPCHNQNEKLKFCLESLAKQNFSEAFEIIVADDNSKIPLDINDYKDYANKVKLKIVRLKKNLGAATARNIGVLHSKHNLLIFLDADMVIPENYIKTQVNYHKNYDNIVTVGMREKLLTSSIKKIKTKANYKKDFRYEKFIPRSWKAFHLNEKNIFARKYNLLKETDNFKQFGFGKKIGVWSLQDMVVSSSIAIKKKHFLRARGFDIRFPKAWYEDIHFGAKLLANNIKIIPVKSITAYHLVDKIDNDYITNKIIIKNNKKLYNKLIEERIKIGTKKSFIKSINKYAKYYK